MKRLSFFNGSSIDLLGEEERRQIRGFAHPSLVFQEEPLPDWMLFHLDYLRNPYWSPIQNIPTQHREVSIHGKHHQARSQSPRLSPANDTTTSAQDGDEPTCKE